MTVAPDHAIRGSAPVGRILELPPLELQVVIYLRLWCCGLRGKSEVWQDLCARLGEEDAKAALGAFEQFFATLAVEARRPLQRHGVECPCVGGDEAAIATTVALAASGDREDAALILSWLAPPRSAPILAALAEEAGLLLAGSWRPPRASAPSAPPGPVRRRLN